MIFRIHWSNRALTALAQLWLDDPSQRAEINQATKTVDRLLQIEPEQQGESREENRRIVFVSPLAVTFSVDVARHVVRILNIRPLKRRG